MWRLTRVPVPTKSRFPAQGLVVPKADTKPPPLGCMKRLPQSRSDTYKYRKQDAVVLRLHFSRRAAKRLRFGRCERMRGLLVGLASVAIFVAVFSAMVVLAQQNATSSGKLLVVLPIPAGVTVRADIQNLLDRNCLLRSRLPKEGRNWFMNVRYQF
jgi:hypothetical protein